VIDREAVVPHTLGRRALALLLPATLALALAGCARGGLPPAPSTFLASALPAGPPPTDAPTPAPTEVPGPPAAALDGVALESGPAALGSLGTFSWDGLTSDAPWIVPSGGRTAAAGTQLTVAFDPGMAHTGWEARWAHVIPGAAGDPVAGDSVAGGEGQAEPVVVTVPAAPGTWGLMVETSFGQGRNGVWYWRIDVVP
jgi:hypothetical protein